MTKFKWLIKSNTISLSGFDLLNLDSITIHNGFYIYNNRYYFNIEQATADLLEDCYYKCQKIKQSIFAVKTCYTDTHDQENVNTLNQIDSFTNIYTHFKIKSQ